MDEAKDMFKIGLFHIFRHRPREVARQALATCPLFWEGACIGEMSFFLPNPGGLETPQRIQDALKWA